jgi:peptidoglycan/xylan/chitin deacetylase (PgdA/CDA1 family)
MDRTSGPKVLMYHWVSGDPGERLRAWGVTPEQFESQMQYLSDEGYRVVPLDEVVATVRGKRPSSEREVAITFDDGYRDFLEHAAPVLRRFSFAATIFLVADRVGQTNSWDARHGDRPRPLMGWSEAAALAAAGMEIGSHARTHRFLPALSDQELEDEIRGSKRILEDRLGREMRFFSYPHGLHDERALRWVAAAGYAAGCSDIRGGNASGTDPLLLRRTLVTCHETRWSFGFKCRTGFGAREWTQWRISRLRGARPPAGREAVA